MSLSSEERKEILELLANGKITADEAAKLLSQAPPAVSEAPAPPAPLAPPVFEKAADPPVTEGDKPSWLHVRVTDLATGQGKVTVNIPLRLLKFGLSVGSRFAPELEGMDWRELSSMMTEEKGVLVDVQDEEDGEHVQIYVD
jgi:DNA-binding transcriptional ArsR family regulator